ncbi:hypothetical protein, partial [Nocardia sp. NPDC057455]|uniref:hypothetical protein n=1 Tax=Nocardia sp. NPDC057455 TaxID=3346138 RepID=UPI00366F34E8
GRAWTEVGNIHTELHAWEVIQADGRFRTGPSSPTLSLGEPPWISISDAGQTAARPTRSALRISDTVRSASLTIVR